MFREAVEKADAIEEKIRLKKKQGAGNREIEALHLQKAKTLSSCAHPAAKDCVYLARKIDRPHTGDYIRALFTDFFEQKGDHLYNDDHAVLGGIARFHGLPVTVVGHQKGHTADELRADRIRKFRAIGCDGSTAGKMPAELSV